MDTAVLLESFSDFKQDKNIDRVTLMTIVEEVFRGVFIKKYGRLVFTNYCFSR